MFLEKLEIQGFKSFAHKNILVFPQPKDKKRGITAIVGPNGSGKSNIADAVRWVLGEQSMKLLRGKKSEDVIFSGSDKKGRLSLAEVSLYFNNEDRQFPLDYSQIVLTRRLYRSGESEYLINNNRTRLSDIQILLAKANFGQKTYSVIGQGMVEGFLNTSLAERKEFFDEATGVKQFQIKRDNSLNKLRQSYKNLQQAKMLLAEIEPRLRSLTRQVNKLQKREQLEAELRQVSLLYYGYRWQKRIKVFNNYNQQLLDLEEKFRQLSQELNQLEEAHSQIKSHSRLSKEIARLQAQADEWQKKKDEAVKKLARQQAILEIGLEQSGQTDTAWLLAKKQELEKEKYQLEKTIKNLGQEIKDKEKQVQDQARNLKKLEKDLDQAQKKLNILQQRPQEEKWRLIAQKLTKIFQKIQASENETDLVKIKQTLKEIKAEIAQITADFNITQEQKDYEFWQNKAQELTQQREQLLLLVNENRLAISTVNEKKNLLKIKIEQLNKDIAEIKEKLAKKDQKPSKRENQAKQQALEAEIKKIEAQLQDLQAKIKVFSQEAEEREQELIAQQAKIQAKQEEVTQTSWQLNELKVKAAKEETRLEDLENEIRKNQLSLKEIKEFVVDKEVDEKELEAKIANLKRQLELIGGIDPEVEKEYAETKERFDFLTAQVADLTQAIGSLEKVIKELDQIIKEKFDKEFKVIAKKFNEYFRILFGGGQAKIIKVKEEQVKIEIDNGKQADEFSDIETGLKQIKFLQKHNATGLAGVEIQATPPGKKIRSIAMLSGGERALVAIALICAIISANPSPFVVLDEVDAALDEANSQRLARILDELSYRTQFIVITHNRATMRQASVLYGVTMGDDGVSQLLSVKLDQAKKMSQ